MSQRFDIISTTLAGLVIIQRKLIGDQRGYLERLFCQDELQTLMNGKAITQVNHTLTEKKGTIRGMHFQYPPHAECKIVSCLRGEVFDVAVDLRQDSATFLHWHGEILSADNHTTLMIPEGFAHGFQTLSEQCEMLYFHTANYMAEAEGGVHALDPKLDIAWPFAVAEQSKRDQHHPWLTDDFQGVSL